jgi:hypothetical protein
MSKAPLRLAFFSSLFFFYFLFLFFFHLDNILGENSHIGQSPQASHHSDRLVLSV